jgi:sucrose-6-phosphate hydrolase SacC (GH32 family)
MKNFKRLLLMAVLLTSAVAPATEGGFLFATFKGEQTPMSEQVYFALSRDGRNWTALNAAEPVLISKLGEKGMRDPYLLRSHDGTKTFLIATDLSINLNRDWGRAVRAGSKSLMIWESPDLVNWGEPRLVKVAPDDAGCTWAPEAIYDEETKDYLVFWASTTARDNFDKHRIWAAHTKDFVTFEKPFIYLERERQVIDTTIVRDQGKYYRFSKDEHSKAIIMETGEKVGGDWQEVKTFSLSHLRGYEGPQGFVLKPAQGDQPATWCLILDHYARGQGYQPYVTTNLSSGEFTPGTNFNFPFRFRHGSVLAVSEAEFKLLESAYSKVPTAGK